MYSIFFTSLLLSLSTQHFITPPTWCELASMCNHTGIHVCARDVKQENDSNITLFKDDCDMVEYNCDNVKEYDKVEMIYCQTTKMSTIPASLPKSVTPPPLVATVNLAIITPITNFSIKTNYARNSNKTSTMVTLSTLSLFTISSTASSSVLNASEATIFDSIVPTQQSIVNRSTASPESTTDAISSSLRNTVGTSLETASQLTTNSFKDGLKTKGTLTTALVTDITNLTTNYTINSSQTIATTDNLPINSLTSTRNSSRDSELTTALVTDITNLTTNYTSNSSQTITTKDNLPINILTSTLNSSHDSESTFLSTSSTIDISTSMTNVSGSKILQVNETTKQTNKISDPSVSNCTRHTNATNSITSNTTPTMSLTTSLSTTVPIPFTTENITTDSTMESTITIDVVTTTVTTLVSNPQVLNTTQPVTEPITITGTSETLVPCERYPIECNRPSTWETTARGETRDFFQILRAKFGTRVRLLRATTHWPLRVPYLINDGHFIFGRHRES